MPTQRKKSLFFKVRNGENRRKNLKKEFKSNLFKSQRGKSSELKF